MARASSLKPRRVDELRPDPRLPARQPGGPTSSRRSAGTPLADVTLEAVRAGGSRRASARATPETLRRQAAVARAAGRRPLAENLERAAELALVPGRRAARRSTRRCARAARRRRSSRRWAARLDGYGAERTAAFVREAAAVYERARAPRTCVAGASSHARRRELRRETARVAASRARPRRRRRAARSRARARGRGRRRRATGRPRGRRLRRDRPLRRRARARPRRRRARRWRSTTSSSRGCSSTSTCRARELVRLARGLTPAKLARVIGLLDPVELMLALKKLRARRAPANQAHVTNLKESPALLAADAAEAARRGFAEIETTVGVARYAPLNAISLLIGSQTGRPGRDDAVRGRGAAQPRAGVSAGSSRTPRRSRSTARSRSSSTATTRPGRRRSSAPPTPRAA